VSGFVPLPAAERIEIAWPTPNHFLFEAPEKFFARTRANPDYGKPGWTRDCGRRLHRGCDIAPVNATATGQTTTVVFTDCASGRDYESVEPTWAPRDEVFCVYDGLLVEVVDDESASDFGRHVVVEHRWPLSGECFFTLYAHLARLSTFLCAHGYNNVRVSRGQRLGWMGQSSRSADARNWLAIAPHLHFEARDAAGNNYDPVEFLRRFVWRG
jgi:murein DD-endopeptidase MepM/ murein hydrolase activator NlpD